MDSLNELLVRLKYVDAGCRVQRGDCLCQDIACGYHAWRKRFQVGRKSSAPAADPEEAIRLARQPRALWDTPYNADQSRVNQHRCLTHLGVVSGLLHTVTIEPSTTILDCCGGTNDAVAVALRAHGCDVVTNDIVHCRVADHHLDAASMAFVQNFSENIIDWVISSPPYGDDCARIIQNALTVARCGVCMKVRLSFLEPCNSRREFLLQNPVSLCIVVPRLTYGSRRSSSPECWLVWDKTATYSQQIVYGV